MGRIAKQQACQKYIYKIHSARLRKEHWRLTLPIDEARRNDEIISLADSQILRWIDSLNGMEDADSRARTIKEAIKQLRRAENSAQNRQEVRRLYKELDTVQMKPDYLCLIIDRERDYYRACRGFTINGIRYKRLLGTNGGIKNSTIVFVSERLHDELLRRIDNGRDLTKELVPAKLEAYRALACSASIPVSMPNGVIVVDDAETSFTDSILYLTDEGGGEPVMEAHPHETIHLDATDGCGMILPSLARRWSDELMLGYCSGGFNTRFAFEKGMVFAFDFVDFADKVAGRYFVKDAWGTLRDVRKAEMILTTSMVKLWDSYRSCEDYLHCAQANGYTFGVTKTCPEALENERTLNYQFIQSYALSDEDIDELIAPTVNEIRDVLGGDWRKMVLFLKGSGLNEQSIARMENDYAKAVMIEPKILDDPYVQKCVYQLIRNRINEAKVGVLKVHGNYSMISGDLYLLCQHMFGMELTGLLRRGEVFNRYWMDHGNGQMVCFRAPMTCHNNIRLVRQCSSDEAAYWFRYMPTCTVLNAWDTITMALNGCDFDGDLVMLTDNPVLLRRHMPLPALMCVQRKAAKCVPSEDDLIRSNIASFGNEIGQTTNWITSMFELQAKYEPGTPEHETLAYRIRCGQLYQQNAIDKAKGIVCKPMPKSWHDRHSTKQIEDTEQREMYRSIAVERKPYFMRYIYPALMRQYNTYIRNTDRNALREFGMTVREITELPAGSRTERQQEFIQYYMSRMPVGTEECVMNRICRKIEAMFDSHDARHRGSAPFDFRILTGGGEYSTRQFNGIRKLLEDYNRRLSSYAVFADYERIDGDESAAALGMMNAEFRRECDLICQNGSTLCDILLELCYTRSSTKRFVWSLCGEEIIQNLLKKNKGLIRYPALCQDGDLLYGGERYTVVEYIMGVEEHDRNE